MAGLQMDRAAAKALLRQMQPQMMAMFASQKGDAPLYGEEMTLELGTGTRKIMHYASGKAKAPAYFDIHGGGYTWGTISDGDTWNHQLCETFGWEVYSLDYPLVPDEEYPTQIHWVYETISYIRSRPETFHVDPDDMRIGGRSAGGNMAAAICLYAKEKGEFSFKAQVLDHPWLDLCGIVPWEERYLGEGALTQEVMEGLALGYAEPEQAKESLCSPLAASDSELKGLPPAIIQTCERDSLRPEGDLYAERLASAGVPVLHHCFPGALHGFTEGADEIAEQGRQWLIAKLKEIAGS